MKAVALICILSFSLCLSEKTEKPGATSEHAGTDVKQQVTQPPATTTQTTKQKATENSAPKETPVDNASQGQTSSTPQQATEKSELVKNQTGVAPTNSTNIPAVIVTDDKNTTEHKSAVTPPATNAPKESSPASTKGSNTTAIEITTPKNETGAPVTSTLKPETPKAPSDKTPVEVKSNFSGASFVGGIILTLGLLAIGFIGFKYYKNRTESNYHTL